MIWNRKANKFLSISDEDILMIVLAFMSFSIGIWTNYRGLWLESVGFSVVSISRIISVALICSAIISFVISLFSTKVKIKNVIQLSIIIRSISMLILLFNRNEYIIKICMLLTIMCDVMFSIAYYPLLSTVNKGESAFRKQNLINYLAKDAGVILCGLLFGITIGTKVFDYNTCLFVAIVTSILSGLVLILFNQNKYYKKSSNIPIKKAIKNLYKSKINNYFLFTQFIMNISYGIIFGLMMLLLTNYINFSVSVASIFIIVCNLVGSIACSLFIKYGKSLSTYTSIFIKYGSRVIIYLLAFLFNNNIVFIIAIIIAHVTGRILEDKINGVYVRRIDTDSQFLFGNIRYFVLSLGEGIGTYLAGYLIQISFRSIFLGAAVFTILQIILFVNLGKIKE